MRISTQLTDSVILKELGGRLARVRLDRNLTQAELATRAGISKRTVERFEAGAGATQLSTVLRLCRVLELLERFDALIPEATPSPIALLKMRGKERRRASTPKPTDHVMNEPPGQWTWGPKA